MKLGLIIVLSILIICSNSYGDDEDCHKTINFINNSELDIYLDWDRNYPDTLYFQYGPSPDSDENNKVLAGTSSDTPLWYQSCWESVIGGDGIPSDTLMVYVFDAEVIENEDWDDVTEEY